MQTMAHPLSIGVEGEISESVDISYEIDVKIKLRSRKIINFRQQKTKE
jgi:hypothetical protein